MCAYPGDNNPGGEIKWTDSDPREIIFRGGFFLVRSIKIVSFNKIEIYQIDRQGLAIMQAQRLRIAIQKKGRLSKECQDLLKNVVLSLV